MSEVYFHKSLRHKNIDYSRGQFFVTMQVEHNASLLGVIVGGKSILNELGKSVQAELERLPEKYPELALGEYVIMPNHVHLIVTIKPQPTNKEQHLGYLMGRFKGATSYIYGQLKRTGKVADIGKHLWQSDYWENLISSEDEYRNYEQYIRNNPQRWTQDRWGAVTQYMLGDAALLNMPKRAFVASQLYDSQCFAPRRIEILGRGTSVPLPSAAVLISTFTSPQEREILRRAILKKKRIIYVCPQGIPSWGALSPEQQLALKEKRLLFISPQPNGSVLNKKVAAWCNEYVLRQAQEIWVGDISPNGMLDVLMKGLRQEKEGGTEAPLPE